MAITSLHVALLLGSCCLASAGSEAMPEWQQQDSVVASDSVSLLQTSAARKMAPSATAVLPQSALQNRAETVSETWLRDMSKAPQGTDLVDRYKACTMKAPPFIEKAEIYINEASKTKYVHIFKNAGTVVLNSIKGAGGFMVAGYNEKPGTMENILKSPEQWFVASVVRDPLTRSLDGFHEVWKRIHCSAPVGQCGSGENRGFAEPEHCFPCTQNHEEHVYQWIRKFGELLPKLQTKVDHGEGLFGHMYPQLSYLTYDDGSKVDLDYLGSMDDRGMGDLEKEFDFIFLSETGLVHNITASAGLAPGGEERFRIRPSQLQDDVIVQVCSTYKVDYCCFGYEFPDACKKAGFRCG
mmetsp:Transcript_11419/g.21392  ORF Transcript_11419/g.21392 Transcript_11419/m.21392 type:complete len:353 (+) Transcript_11419:46-1104(+)